jgi:fatty-acyl-CoA synthase
LRKETTITRAGCLVHRLIGYRVPPLHYLEELMSTPLAPTDPAASLLASRRNHWNAHLDRHAFMNPDRVAFRFERRAITWAEFRNRVMALAAALARRGVQSGDRVAVLMGNRPEFVETLLAANRLGAIAVPVNFRLTGPEAAYILEDSGSQLLFTDQYAEHIARSAAEEMASPVPTVVVGATEWATAENYDLLLAESGEECPVVDVAEEATALIMYTSGTTGRPKGALLSHQNLLSQSLTYIAVCRLETGHEVNLVASPMFHIGAIGSIAPMIYLGGTMLVLPTGAFDSGQVLELLEVEKVSNVFLVPTQWQALCDDPTVTERDLSALRSLCWGAAPATDTLLKQMAETFPTAENVSLFGQTEMSPVTCALDGADALRKLGSIGKPVPAVSVRIVDEAMNDVPEGQVGEIVYRGAGLMSGYWNKPEATAEAFEGGWFHSGDLVRRDEDGFLFVVDRVKDMIISGGENIYCAEVENALSEHPAIREVSVIGRPHPKWGETPVAVVVWDDAQNTVELEELRAWASAYLAKYKLPTVIETVEVLPRNPSGKVLKTELRDRFAATDAGA